MIARVVLLVSLLAVPSISHAGLIERIMGEPGYEKISVHAFWAINNERIEGRATRQNAIDYLGLAGQDITDYDQLANAAPKGTTTADRIKQARFNNSVHSIFLLAEIRAPGYDTPANVLSKIVNLVQAMGQ